MNQETNYKAVVGKLEVSNLNTMEKILKPEIRIYDNPQTLTYEASIQTNFLGDHYLTMSNIDRSEYYNIKFQHKPLMIWIWISVVLLSFGEVLSLFKMLRIIRISIVLLFVFILLVFYNSLNRKTNYSTDYLVGNKLANINLKSFDNKKIFTNMDFRKNKYTLINFWASWCAPCRVEHPYLIQLSKEKNLYIVGVNFKDKKNNALNF